MAAKLTREDRLALAANLAAAARGDFAVLHRLIQAAGYVLPSAGLSRSELLDLAPSLPLALLRRLEARGLAAVRSGRHKRYPLGDFLEALVVFATGDAYRVASARAVAEAFAVTVRTVYLWRQEGMPAERDGTYDLRRVAAWREARRGAAPELADLKRKQVEADTRFRTIKADLAALQLAIREGKLVDAEAAEDRRVEQFHALNSALAAIPPAVAAELEGLTTPEIEARLALAHDGALTTLLDEDAAL